MALEYRNGRPYYYRNKRENGTVIRQYIASGQMAEFAADSDAHQRAQRESRRAAEEQKQRAYVTAREQLFNVIAQAETLSSALLIDVGYHRQNRGPWRRRRFT